MASALTNTEQSPGETGDGAGGNRDGGSDGGSDSGRKIETTAIGLGIGLGVGIPLTIGVVGYITFLFWRTRRGGRPTKPGDLDNVDQP